MKLKCEIEIDVNGQMTIREVDSTKPLWSSYVRNASAEIKSLATKVVEVHEQSVREIKERIK